MVFGIFRITCFFKFWKWTNKMIEVICLIYNSPIAQHDAIYDTIWCDFKTCLNLSKNLFKLVQTCSNSFKLVQNCNMTKLYQICCNLTQSDMSKLVIMLWYDFIWFYKHVQTCHNAMIRFDTILQTCPDLSWYDLIRFYKHVQTCHDTIWYNSTNMYKLVQN